MQRGPARTPPTRRPSDSPAPLYEYPFGTTRAVANLLFSGILDRHPGLRIIPVPRQWNRALPGQASHLRLHRQPEADSASAAEPARIAAPPLLRDGDVSQSQHLIALASFIGTDRILFGADYPFMPESETAETIAGLGEFFGPPALANIEQNNAAALVPRLAAIRA